VDNFEKTSNISQTHLLENLICPTEHPNKHKNPNIISVMTPPSKNNNYTSKQFKE